MAEAKAIRRIIEDRFGKDHARDKRWLVCGDMNDYRERVLIGGDVFSGYKFEPVREQISCLDLLLADGFCENLVERRPELDRWTLYHTRGPQERHLCQLDYILASPALAKTNSKAVPDIVRSGQPYRTPFPPGQEVDRYPRGWLGSAESLGSLSGSRHPGYGLSVTFDIPRNAITLVERVEVRLDPLPHPFEGAYPEAMPRTGRRKWRRSPPCSMGAWRCCPS
jgi:hypothetical protein